MHRRGVGNGQLVQLLVEKLIVIAAAPPEHESAGRCGHQGEDAEYFLHARSIEDAGARREEGEGEAES